MNKWDGTEKGPECFCGMPTGVILDEDGRASLLCLFHTNAEGSMFPLPKEKPEKWPDLTRDELDACMTLGAEESDILDDE